MRERNTKRYTVGRCIAMLFASAPAALVLVVAAALWFGGFIFNIAFAWTWVLLPLLTVILCHKTIFSELSIGGKIGSMIAVYVIVVPVFLFSLFVGKFEMKWVDRDHELAEVYVNVAAENPFLPAVELVGVTLEQRYIEYESTQAVFFDIHVDTLICRYAPEEYALQKRLIDEQTVFRSEVYTYDEFVCEPAAIIDGYSFRMIDSPDVYYPHRLGFIATNDDTCEIVWLSFVDDDLDYIADLSEFILDECGWKHMR